MIAPRPMLSQGGPPPGMPMPMGGPPPAQGAQPGQPPQPGPQAAPGPPPGPSTPPVTIDSVMALMRDNAHRRFRIEIEVDSTIAGDETQERESRMQFIDVVTKFLAQWGELVVQQPLLTKMAGDFMLFLVRGFRAGRTLETVIEETVEQLEQQAGMPKQPQPSPDDLMKMQTAKIKGAAEIQKAQIDAWSARIDASAKAQAARYQMIAAEQEHAHEMQRGQQEAAVAAAQVRNEAASNMMKNQLENMRFQRAVAQANAPPKPTGGSQ